MDVELAEVRDFLGQHAPFDRLPAHVLEQVPGHCTLRYARRGSVVVEAGEQGQGLYIVRSGAVEAVDEFGALIERVAAGGAFGMSSLLEGRPTRHRCTATEDTLLIVMSPECFATLARDHLAFATFYAATHHARLRRAIGALQQASSGGAVLTTPVLDLVTRKPVSTTGGVSIRGAAQAMAQERVSSIVVVDRHGLLGILTDRDLRIRVIAAGLDPERPVSEVMTPAPVTLRENAAAFEALLEMVTRHVHHLPIVTSSGRLVGVITSTDLMRHEGINPVYLAADITRQTDLDEVVSLARRIPAVLARMVERDATAADIGRVVTALGDAVRRRVVALVEESLGGAPAAYAWVVLGSAAREEEALAADQDHALVLADHRHDAWFADFAERVTDALERCGWPRCPGEVMAANPAWRLTVPEWAERFTSWSTRPDADAVLHAAIFHDMRHLSGAEELARQVCRIAAQNVSSRLLGHLSAEALRMRPPLGFFRGFVLEREGDHQESLDIKRGIAAVVQLARVHALRAGSDALSTRSRIDVAETEGHLDADLASDLRSAWELMSYRRLRHQVEQAAAGEQPDNRITPARLTERQQRHLKDAFAIVTSAQHQLANRMPPGYL